MADHNVLRKKLCFITWKVLNLFVRNGVGLVLHETVRLFFFQQDSTYFK
jgi:hypothetical protein